MSKVWVIIANNNFCRIYDYNRKAKTLAVIKELHHPESKLREQDLISDKPGHYKSSNGARSAYEPNKDHHEIEIERFVHEIAHELKIGINLQHYQNLILILPPQMSGLIQAVINKNVRDSILENIVKDYTHLDEEALIKTIQESLKVY